MENIILSVGIACVPKRIKDAIALKKSFPPTWNVSLGCDQNYKGSWEGHRLAWESYSPNATHHLTVEDDIVLCEGFENLILDAIHAVPNQIISIYATKHWTSKGTWAIKNKTNWYRDAYGASGQGVLMPVPLLKEFLAWEKLNCPPQMPYEDSRLWGFMFFKKLFTWNTVPALVNHTKPTDSILGFSNKGKVAGWFKDEHPEIPIHWNDNLSVVETKTFSYEYGEPTIKKWAPHLFRS